MTALQPWSGSFGTFAKDGSWTAGPMLWATAHTTQFTEADGSWSYLAIADSSSPARPSGAGMLQLGGSYVTLKNFATGDFTLVVEKMSRNHSSCVRPVPPPFVTHYEDVVFALRGGLAAVKTLALWKWVQGRERRRASAGCAQTYTHACALPGACMRRSAHARASARASHAHTNNADRPATATVAGRTGPLTIRTRRLSSSASPTLPSTRTAPSRCASTSTASTRSRRCSRPAPRARRRRRRRPPRRPRNFLPSGPTTSRRARRRPRRRSSSTRAGPSNASPRATRRTAWPCAK